MNMSLRQLNVSYRENNEGWIIILRNQLPSGRQTYMRNQKVATKMHPGLRQTSTMGSFAAVVNSWNELFMVHCWPTEDVKPYFQQGPLLRGFYHHKPLTYREQDLNPCWTWVQPSWMKLCSRDNHADNNANNNDAANSRDLMLQSVPS